MEMKPTRIADISIRMRMADNSATPASRSLVTARFRIDRSPSSACVRTPVRGCRACLRPARPGPRSWIPIHERQIPHRDLREQRVVVVAVLLAAFGRADRDDDVGLANLVRRAAGR